MHNARTKIGKYHFAIACHSPFHGATRNQCAGVISEKHNVGFDKDELVEELLQIERDGNHYRTNPLSARYYYLRIHLLTTSRRSLLFPQPL